MENKNYLNDLKDIKEMMSKSSQFISLSGLSGVLAGFYALIGAYMAYKTIYFDTSTSDSYANLVISENAVIKLFIIAISVLLLSIATGILLSLRKAKESNDSIWNATSKRLVINFMIPLSVGGYMGLYLIEKENFALLTPLTLIFYGLACVNASKYTLGDVRYLGLTMIILGIANTFFVGYGLLFGALGFGFCHIFYGGIMWFKYERK
ncbi:hypothetical protein [Flavobacterium facile]|uniref:hypothetical protein n=1 Tax=Flavobacterium facile TaxID=2893174 RepID=UPI002E7A9EC6|nr:hypothetical protein [Flavobacterium sp. T-12]